MSSPPRPRIARGGVPRAPGAGAEPAAAFWQSTLDALPVQVCVVNQHGEIDAVNEAWARVAWTHHGGAGSGIGANYLDVCAAAQGDDAETARRTGEAIRRVLAGGDAVYEAEYPCHSPDAERWFVVRVAPFPGPGPRRAVVLHQEVTARVEAERRNREQAALLNAIDAAVVATDLRGVVTQWNRGAEQLYGWAAERAVGRRVIDLGVGPRDRVQADRMRAAALACGLWEGEFASRDARGRCFPAHARVTVVRDEHGAPSGLTGIAVDISARTAGERSALGKVGDLAMLGRVRDALREESLVLFAQPIVSLASGAVVQHELLVRMREGERLIAPGEFLPVAERYGLIQELDRYVIRRALAIAADGHPVQVNVSADSLSDPGLLRFVESELEDSGASPQLVVFELTETGVLGSDAAAKWFVNGVSELGCQVALDDFGSGYGAFRYLKHLPVSYLKIDREFVSGFDRDGADGVVVEAVVRVARRMGLQTVAEGVEDEPTLAAMRRLGVDFAQGYLLGRPAPVAEVFARDAGPPGRERGRLCRSE